METMTVKEQYAAELKQSELDHHKPTAGAMTNHIVSNLAIQAIRLQQVKWYVKGPSALAIQRYVGQLLAENHQLMDDLGQVLLDEGELPASTTKEYQEYTMLTEDGATKYESSSVMLTNLVNDYNTQNLFVSRAIKLAEQEGRPVLSAYLVKINGVDNRRIREIQGLLGQTARAGLDEEDDDED